MRTGVAMAHLTSIIGLYSRQRKYRIQLPGNILYRWTFEPAESLLLDHRYLAFQNLRIPQLQIRFDG